MLLFSVLTIEDETKLPQTPTVDEALILAIGQKDKRALAELYAQTDSAVYGFALSILKNTQDAEDVMQETYLKVYAGAASYRCQGKPMAWILTIVRNCAFEKLRKAKNNPIISQEEGEALQREAFLPNEEDRLILNAAMHALTGEERQIITLHAVAGLKHREISAILQLPLSTVLSKYQRALKKLRQILEEELR